MCNTVIDNPGRLDKHRLVKEILSFLETDTVLFYGEEPPELLQAQIQKWSPIILWFRDRFGVTIEPTTDVMAAPVTQCAYPKLDVTCADGDDVAADLQTLEKYLLSQSYEALQGFSFCVDALKSLILAVAAVERRLTV